MLNYFKKHNIRPKPANEAQRRALQQQLSRTKSLGSSQKQEKLDYWAEQQERFLQELSKSKNYDIFEMQEFIE